MDTTTLEHIDEEMRAMKVELLPCPFCGGEAGTLLERDTGKWKVWCLRPMEKCGAILVADTKEHVEKTWNRRAAAPSQEAPRSEWIEQCAKVCESLRDKTDWKTNVIPMEVRGHTDAIVACAKAIRSLAK